MGENWWEIVSEIDENSLGIAPESKENSLETVSEMRVNFCWNFPK